MSRSFIQRLENGKIINIAKMYQEIFPLSVILKLDLRIKLFFLGGRVQLRRSCKSDSLSEKVTRVTRSKAW